MSWYDWISGGDGEHAQKTSPAAQLTRQRRPEQQAQQAPRGEERSPSNAGVAFPRPSDRGSDRPAQMSRSEVVASSKGGSKGSSSKAAGPGGGFEPHKVACERVLVRVYDLGTTVLTHPHNLVTRSYGAFHTGVEVYGREWSFGLAEDWMSGVTWCAPGKNRDHTFRETLVMGYCNLSSRQVFAIIEEMKNDWRGSTYNLLSRNCHHFSDALCGRLGVARLPHWINDLAGTGHATADMLDRAYNSVSVPDAFYAVKSGLYLTFAGVPECLGRRSVGPERPAYSESDPSEQANGVGYNNVPHFPAPQQPDDRERGPPFRHPAYAAQHNGEMMLQPPPLAPVDFDVSDDRYGARRSERRSERDSWGPSSPRQTREMDQAVRHSDVRGDLVYPAQGEAVISYSKLDASHGQPPHFSGRNWQTENIDNDPFLTRGHDR